MANTVKVTQKVFDKVKELNDLGFEREMIAKVMGLGGSTVWCIINNNTLQDYKNYSQGKKKSKGTGHLESSKLNELEDLLFNAWQVLQEIRRE